MFANFYMFKFFLPGSNNFSYFLKMPQFYPSRFLR